MDRDVRQIIRFDEVTEPTTDRVRVDRLTVVTSEQSVAVNPCVTFTGCIFDVFKQIKIRISKAAFLPPTPKKQKYRLH